MSQMLQHAMATLQEITPWIAGARLVGDGRTSFQRVHTDTRTLQPGDLFVALRGEHFDAHTFLPQAVQGGAVAAIAERGLSSAGCNGLEVADTRLALGQLAAGWRRHFDLPVIAVTGSNGKTTVTQMLATVLHAWLGDAALATQGNFNNDIGVPMTLLRLRPGHRAAVVEVGMNHPGEMAVLAAMVRPTVALVNNAQREHLEFMQTVQAVAEENGQVIAALPADGVAVFPADDAYAPLWRKLVQQRACVCFSVHASSNAEVVLQHAQWQDGAWHLHVGTVHGSFSMKLHMAGRHNIHNALAAVAAAAAAGVPLDAVRQGIERFVPVHGRSRMLRVGFAQKMLHVVDDSYNANPDSMRAAIDMLVGLPGPHLLVMGDMAEVGEQGPGFHAEAGAYARQRGIACLLAMGPLSREAVKHFGACAQHCGDMAALQQAVQKALPACNSVLVKGSRSMGMERVVQAMRAQQVQGDEPCC